MTNQPKRCPVQLEKGQCVKPLTENRRGHSGGCLVWDDAPERCATEGDDTPASEPTRKKGGWREARGTIKLPPGMSSVEAIRAGREGTPASEPPPRLVPPHIPGFQMPPSDDPVERIVDEAMTSRKSMKPILHAHTRWCTVCGMPKKPVGRDMGVAAANGYCDHECPGYSQPSEPGGDAAPETPTGDVERLVEIVRWALMMAIKERNAAVVVALEGILKEWNDYERQRT